jgi:hypothetical protein
MRVAGAVARRVAPSWLWEEIVSESRFRLLEAVQSGNDIRNLVAYAGQVACSVASDLWTQEHPRGLAVEKLAAEADRISFDELVARPGLPQGFFRGARQRRIVALVIQGAGIEEISAALGVAHWEARRLITWLAEEVRRRYGKDFSAN